MAKVFRSLFEILDALLFLFLVSEQVSFGGGGRGGGVASQVALVVRNPPARAGGIRDTVQSLGREDPLEEGMATHPSILPGESHGQRNLVGYSPWGCKRVGCN